MRILFLTVFTETGASTRYRVYQFLPFLQKENIDWKISPLIPNWYFKIERGIVQCPKIIRIILNVYQILASSIKRILNIWASKNFDVVFIQKDILPIPLQKLLLIRNKNIIFDFDDAIYLKQPQLKGLAGVFANQRRKWLPGMLKICKHVIVSTENLKKYVEKYNLNISIMISSVDTDRFKPKNNKISKNITIGWIGVPDGSKWVNSLNEVFNELVKKYPKLILKLIGSKNIKIQNITTICKNWTINSEVKEIQSFDIGIGPLPDNEYTKAKGGTKILQYMSCEVPVVASPVAIQKEIILNKKTGFLASSNDNWINYLSTLIENVDLRKKTGKAGRDRVINHYSLKIMAPRFISLIKKIANNKN